MPVIKLEQTPFIMMSKDNQSFVVGRSDTKEVVCLGSFNKQFADMFDVDEFLFLEIKEDGTAQEVFPDKNVSPIDFVKFVQNKAIIAAKVGSYWLLPYGFKECAKKVFGYE